MRMLFQMLGLAVILAASVAGGSDSARSEVISAGGFSFSDELGGFRLVSVSGAGTMTDPFVIIEEIFDYLPAILVIRRQVDTTDGQRWRPGAERTHVYLAKTVLNLTNRVWAGFDLELRQELNAPSIYGDGLSFDQILRRGTDVTSDKFAKSNRYFEPADKIEFGQGQVDPGMRLTLRVPITDPTPVAEFYLLQEPRYLFACRHARCGQQFALSAGLTATSRR